MENLSFVQNILIFLGLNAVALLALNVKNNGKYISFGSTLIAGFIFLYMLFGNESFALSESFSLEGNKILLLKLVSILNILMILIRIMNFLK